MGVNNCKEQPLPETSNTIKVLRRLGPIPMLVKVFLVGTAVVASLALLGFALNAEWALVKVGEENNIPTWFSSVQLFVIAAVLSPIVIRDSDRRRPSTWALAVVPGLFILLSLDEVAMFHERLGQWLEVSAGVGAGLRTGPWVLIFVPLVGLLSVAAAVVFWPYLRGRRDVVALAIVGFGVFGLSAVGLELIANLPAGGSIAQKLLGFAEEIGEMLGGSIILWSAVLVMQLEGVRVDLGTPRLRQSLPKPEADVERSLNAPART